MPSSGTLIPHEVLQLRLDLPGQPVLVIPVNEEVRLVEICQDELALPRLGLVQQENELLGPHVGGEEVALLSHLLMRQIDGQTEATY